MKQIKIVLQHSVKCIIRIKKIKMPSFCINNRITEAVTLYKVHEKCSSSVKLLPQWWGCLVLVAFVRSFPLCTEVCVLQVSGWRKKCKGRNHLCRWHFKLLFTAVLVQKCFSKCYFKIGNVQIAELTFQSSKGLCGLLEAPTAWVTRKNHSIAGAGICLKIIVNLVKK